MMVRRVNRKVLLHGCEIEGATEAQFENQKGW